MTAIALWFAGFWPLFLHFGVGAALIVLLIAAAVYFRSLGFLEAAAFVLVALVAVAYGVHIEKVARDAQAKIVTQDVGQAVENTETPAAKKQADHWDNPKY